MICTCIQYHYIKKIRNNIYKNNKNRNPRCLKIGGKSIIWKQLRSGFDWDQQSFSLPLHEKLTIQHLNLDSPSIMRNKLAEDMIDAKMLFLMQVIILLSCMFDGMEYLEDYVYYENDYLADFI